MELHDTYPFVCPFCDAIGQASPSMFMEMGINEGSGKCLCGERLFFKINSDNSRMDVITTEEHNKKVAYVDPIVEPSEAQDYETYYT